MPQPRVDPVVSAARKAAIEVRLREGFSPFGVAGGLGSSVERAAKDLRMKSPNLGKWVQAQKRLADKGTENYLPDWSLFNRAVTRASESRVRKVRRWLLTAAQNDTAIHSAFWNNLNAYAAAIGAEIVVGPFTYQLGVFEDHNTRSNVFAEQVRKHLRFDRMECGEVLFCAEMNTLPTAVRPLSGLHSYTTGRWGVFPHAKIALESVPAMPGKHPPLIMTTGACTVENYIAKKAGLKAKFHHVIGATLVEIAENGVAFCRQINATSDGAFQDLDAKVRAGKVTLGHRIEAINPGDIHCANLDPLVAKAIWGIDPKTGEATHRGLIDTLRPSWQFFHDLFDGESINHWQKDKPHERYPLHLAGKLDVAAEVAQAARFLRVSQRSFCRSMIVESNHDLWISRWLQYADPRLDLTNAEAFHRWNLAAIEAAKAGDHEFSVFRHVLKLADRQELEGIGFIPEGKSFEICADRGGIECSLHGHVGTNFSRGSSAALAKMAAKINKGHDHIASIMDGVFSAGVCTTLDGSRLDGRRSAGPISHSNSLIATYPNGKRTILTIRNGEWRA